MAVGDQTIISRSSLVLLTALAITAFISLPRLLVLKQLGLPNTSIELDVAEFIVRSLYLFGTSLLFFVINMQTRVLDVGFIKIDCNNFWQRLLINIVLFLILVIALRHLHLWLFEPVATKRLFKALFNANMAVAVTITILFAQIFRLIYHNTETRYEVLKNQVNPHFLFNSFNTINNLIVTDQRAAVNYVNNMSDVFRYVLKSSDVKLTTVEEELQFIEAYIHMLKGRYGGKLQVSIDIPSSQLRYRLPPMALQLLVENAVKHNIVSQAKPLHVQITSEKSSLTVCNNLQKRKTTEPSTGIGLINLNQRCKFLSKRALIIRQTPERFAVTIPLLHENTDH